MSCFKFCLEILLLHLIHTSPGICWTLYWLSLTAVLDSGTRASTVRVFKIYAIYAPEFRDKRICQRPKRECERPKHKCGRYVSKAAPHFGNVCVYKPSALRKKPSASSEKTSSERSLLVLQRHATSAFWKGIPNCGINFKDVYRTVAGWRLESQGSYMPFISS